MCNPIALMAGSASMSVMGSVQQGQADNAMAQAKAGQMDYSARVARDDALAQAQMIRKQQRFAIASSDVAAAGSGVVVGEGSAGEANRQIYQDTEHDAYMSILNGERRASGQEIEASLTRTAGANAEKNGYLTGISTALGAGGKITSQPGWKTTPKAGG